MNEHDLMTALEERAGGVVVGPAPLDTMTRTATRTRRRRGRVSGLTAAAAVTVVTVGVVAVLPDDDGTARDRTPYAAPADVDVAPDGFRYVAMGGAAIAVPEAWPADATECGQPTESTYVVDPFLVQCQMYVPFPAEADSVSVEVGGPEVPEGWTPLDIEGVVAYLSPIETGSPDPASGEETVSRATVLVPDERVQFTVASSVSEARVSELLDGIVILDAHVGVPGFRDLELLQYEGGGEPADEAYRERLEAAGLVFEAVDQTDRRRYPSGTVIGVEPAPGALLEAGATVRVTVSR